MTRRYGEAACEAMMKDPAFAPFTVTLADKFGDYGLISVVVLKPAGEDVEIDEYLMSCRVLQRGVESFTMNNIFAYAARRGGKRVVGHYIPTKKNDMVKGFFKSFGFEKIADGDGGASQWALAGDRVVSHERSRPADLPPREDPRSRHAGPYPSYYRGPVSWCALLAGDPFRRKAVTARDVNSIDASERRQSSARQRVHFQRMPSSGSGFKAGPQLRAGMVER
jgi:hypothetical protein